jgi:phosphoglycolate phosphatase-like HAD superfamily hydrolase
MNRRDFLRISAATGLASCLAEASPTDPHCHAFISVQDTIAAVQEHMFPEGGKLPSARSMQATRFLCETIMHPVYDKDIRQFVIEGANRLIARTEHHFTDYTHAQKEEALRLYEQCDEGRHWLSRIMILTMEALFSDPVYGSNIHEAGWQSIQCSGGKPQPENRYISL